MFRLATRALPKSRLFTRSLSQTARRHAVEKSNSYVPLITVGASAITSYGIYCYLDSKSKIKNEESTEKPEAEKLEQQPVEVIEVVEEVIEEPLDVAAAVVSDESALEEEAAKEGAFNEETGEINWDCPCLGGMAHGPCGEEFKAAFSCFVYSKEEPKGIECIEKFKGMQDCFRKYPDVYSEELRDEEALENEVVQTEKAVEQAVMNNDIIESIDEAIVEAKELAYDIYGNAQKKIEEFNDKSKK